MKEKKRSLFSKLLNLLTILITLGVSAMLALSYLSSYVSPESSSLIAVLGLPLFPLMICNFVVLCYWLIRRRAWLVLPLLMLLLGLGRIGDFYQVHLGREYQIPERLRADKDNEPKEILNIATYNVHSFYYQDKQYSREATMDSISAFLERLDVDIVCMQEYTADKGSQAHFDKHFERWPHQEFFAISNYGVRDMGMVIMSRYPLRSARYYRFADTGNAMMFSEVILGKGDTLRLFNVHLQSTEFNRSQPQGLKAMVESEGAEKAVVEVERLLARNFIKRSHQAAILRGQLDSLAGQNVVVVGDFNDTPNSYATTVVKGDDFVDSFRKAGSGYGYSYRPMKHLFRIDYVLYRKEYFGAVGYHSPNLPYSDHKPVVVQLEKVF